MRAFRRHRGVVNCEFEDAELDLLQGLLSQLIELLLADLPGGNGPGTQRLVPASSNDDVFVRLEREMNFYGGEYFADEPTLDPVLQRLFPDPYPHDPAASHDFHRFTRAAQLDDKVAAARAMLGDLQSVLDGGYCSIPQSHVTAWLKTLTNVRLALAVRMNISDAEDAERVAELPDDDPRSWLYSIYEWLGWVQESLLVAQE
ncbi:MAG: DUF2017 family protein [Brooklawnia sp.]|uniref:DUF2017 family protein n=1 Tax=Brooklawnia sp. TaxID=2699740 RepID=UPI003C78612C